MCLRRSHTTRFGALEMKVARTTETFTELTKSNRAKPMLHFKASQRTLGAPQTSQKLWLISLDTVLPYIHCLWISRVLRALGELPSKYIEKFSHLHWPLPSAQPLPHPPPHQKNMASCHLLTLPDGLTEDSPHGFPSHTSRLRSQHLLNPSFLSGWTFWLPLGFSPSLSVHRDRPSLEIAPWQKGAQVRWLGKLGAGWNNSATVMSLRLCSGYPLGPSVPRRSPRGPRRKQMCSANL